MFEKYFLGEIVDCLRREFAGVFERNFDALHRFDFEAIILQKFRKARVHVVLKIGDADQLLHPQRAERVHLGDGRDGDGYLVFFGERIGDLTIRTVTAHHGRRGAHDHYDIGTQFS